MRKQAGEFWAAVGVSVAAAEGIAGIAFGSQGRSRAVGVPFEIGEPQGLVVAGVVDQFRIIHTEVGKTLRGETQAGAMEVETGLFETPTQHSDALRIAVGHFVETANPIQQVMK